jgi:molybdate transport system substrate-binding protein
LKRAVRHPTRVKSRAACRAAALCLALIAFLACGCDSKAPSAAKNKAPPGLDGQGASELPVKQGGTSAAQRSVRVAAASDLQFALKEVVARFEVVQSTCRVEVTYGSSGNLYAQLTNKAPFDMFLSADMSYPRRLAEAGLAAQDSEFLYGIGQIVVWVPASSLIDIETLGMHALVGPRVKKIAIANPKHAPYGRVAEAAMQKLGVYVEAKDRLVLGENIAQTAQFVESGAADVGIIALSLALAPAMKDKGRYWLVPQDAYPRLEQGGVIMNDAKDPAAAGELRSFLMGEEGKTILRSYGFVIPGE